MNREFNAIIKTVFDIIDQISENISDLRDRQEKIKIVLLSMLGTIVGLFVYNNYLTSNELRLNRNGDQEEEFREIKRPGKKDDKKEHDEEEKPFVKLPIKPPHAKHREKIADRT
jgi:hypothetical protein